MRALSISIALLLAVTLCDAADLVVFTPIKIHRHKNAEHRVLVDKLGDLTFDGDARKLVFKDENDDSFEAGYDSVVKVVFEVTTHMRGGVLAEVISAGGLPGAVAGSVISGGHVHDYWFYLEYKNGDRIEQVLLEAPKKSADEVKAKATVVFGDRVTTFDPTFNFDNIDPDTLPDIRSKQRVKVDRENHPMPESKPDKATIVVVCPPLAARYAGAGNQFKLHANNHVIAVNRGGTYSFAYLDPGKYKLVSQSENANGFEMELEAGKTYYFLQNIFKGTIKGDTMLSRNSPELVLYELNGSYFSNWKGK